MERLLSGKGFTVSKKEKKKGRFTTAEFNAILGLYLLTQGRGRITANNAVLAINALGLECKMHSVDRGYSTRGSRAKLPPDLFIAFDGKRYGACHNKKGSFADSSLSELADEVMSRLSPAQIRVLEITSLCQQLIEQGVSKVLTLPITMPLEWEL